MSNKEDHFQKFREKLKEFDNSEDWLNYLKFSKSFYDYSFQNRLYIWIQKPTATFVKGFKQWNQLGRYVRKGEKGIAIMAPLIKKDKEKDETSIIGFKTTYVFDISQTEGEEVEIPVLVTGIKGNTKEELYHALKEKVSAICPVFEEAIFHAKGYYKIKERTIHISANVDYDHRIHTLFHELSHHYDYELVSEETKDPTLCSKEVREFIAESCAYVACGTIGLDTSSYSVPYVKTWLSGKEDIFMNFQFRMNTIVRKIESFLK